MDKLSLRLNALDTRWCVRLNRTGARREVALFFRLVSQWGNGAFWYGLMAVLLVYGGREALLPVAHMAATGLVGTLIYKWLKRRTLRPRPYAVHPDVTCLTAPLDQFSFPSGHTLHAVAFSLVALAYFPFVAPVVIPFTLACAASRVVLGLHYPSDVLAGAVLGAAIAGLSLSLAAF
jgi:undecaprenyl-diphosphatase